MKKKRSTKSNILEHDKDMVSVTTKKVENYFKGSKSVLSKHQNPRKYSEIFYEYMQPAIEEVIDDEKLLQSLLDLGQYVWNKAVAMDFPDHPKSKSLIKLFPLFEATVPDRELISDFLKRRMEMFATENFFIVKQAFLLNDDGRLAISVAVLQIED